MTKVIVFLLSDTVPILFIAYCFIYLVIYSYMRSLKRAQRPILGDNYEQKPSKNANLQDESYKIRMILQPTFSFFFLFFFLELPRSQE